MSDEPQKSRMKWQSRLAVYALSALVSYFAFHRATGHYNWGVERDDLGHMRRKIYRQHWYHNKPVPPWVESVFKPASRFDDLIGYSPNEPSCILMPPERF
ncbi:MAG TPA: hypothetical protein VFG04_12355 [Planctomycetaceae bacterium]|nr:hypothetical protein [Planctomycetaceae bacterium]